jgi:hypothetical protein
VEAQGQLPAVPPPAYRRRCCPFLPHKRLHPPPESEG